MADIAFLDAILHKYFQTDGTGTFYATKASDDALPNPSPPLTGATDTCRSN